jgi:FtsP/CotA-like multicopper oxidase with cupredoxin domain
MKETLHIVHRLFLTAVLATAAAAALAHAAAAGPAAPDVPIGIQAPEGNKPFLVGHAVGVQIWTCRAVGDGHAWEFVAPRANLYGGNGKLLTTHFAGPTWQARDGSYVKAAVHDRATVDPTAIPWLLLAVTEASPADDGRLSATTFIQRIATAGGLAPSAAACGAGTAGTIAEVPYTADYVFWKAHR